MATSRIPGALITHSDTGSPHPSAVRRGTTGSIAAALTQPSAKPQDLAGWDSGTRHAWPLFAGPGKGNSVTGRSGNRRPPSLRANPAYGTGRIPRTGGLSLPRGPGGSGAFGSHGGTRFPGTRPRRDRQAPDGGAEYRQHEKQERDDVDDGAVRADVADLEQLGVNEVEHEAHADDERTQTDDGGFAPAGPPGPRAHDRDKERVEREPEHGHREDAEDHRLCASGHLSAVDQARRLRAPEQRRLREVRVGEVGRRYEAEDRKTERGPLEPAGRYWRRGGPDDGSGVCCRAGLLALPIAVTPRGSRTPASTRATATRVTRRGAGPPGAAILPATPRSGPRAASGTGPGTRTRGR